MTFRAPLEYVLPATAEGWELSSVRSFVMRRVREHAVTHNASVVDVTDWGYLVEDVPGRRGGRRVRVTCVATLRSRRELIDAVQALMAERHEHIRCAQCSDYADVDRLRFTRDLTVKEACAQLGHNERAYYRHRNLHPLKCAE